MTNAIIIDNYDSFTYNLRDLLGSLGHACTVVRNDELSLEQVIALQPTHLLLSPGPGSPDIPSDVGISFEVLDYAMREGVPLLGVCLGQQILAHHLGSRVVRAPQPMHGKTSHIRLHHPRLVSPDLFAGFGDELTVMRYHSLMCEVETRHPDLVNTAYLIDENGIEITMAIQHRSSPIYGVQFHPESLFTERGIEILKNFMNVPRKDKRAGVRARGSHGKARPKNQSAIAAPQLPPTLESLIESVLSERRPCTIHDLECNLPPERVYERMSAIDHCFCFESLDPDGLAYRDGGMTGRYSYFGMHPRFVVSARNGDFFVDDKRVLLNGSSPLQALEMLHRRLKADVAGSPPDQLLRCGLVGCFAYEAMQYREPSGFLGKTPENERTFCFGYYEDVLLFDNKRSTYVYCTTGRDRGDDYRALLEAHSADADAPSIHPVSVPDDQADFERSIRDVIENEIAAGNAQQVVMSRRTIYRIQGSMGPLYRAYRDAFPSCNMHAVRMGDMETIGSFPELMMRCEDKRLTTIQLAGTRRRSGDKVIDAAAFADLKTDAKECAEHRMLVDLARNDIGRSSVPGSVRVPDDSLMARMDAGPVLHIASTICGILADGVSPVLAHANLSPMGTVSGSPKIRACRIIHHVERGKPRGLYAGSCGFFDSGGSAEFVIGLRNIVRCGDELRIQAGAGIVKDSDPAREYTETQSKMRAPLQVIEPFLQSALLSA